MKNGTIALFSSSIFVEIFMGWVVIPGLTFALAKGVAFCNGGPILGGINPFTHNVKNCQTYFKNLVVFTPQDFLSVFGHLQHYA